jgi:hypothetical protein
MTIAFRHDDLFEVNSQLSTQRMTVDGLGDIAVIDNFYKFPWEINTMLEDSWSQLWKTNDKSRNGIDYFDCRLMFQGFDTGSTYQYDAQRLIQDVSRIRLGIELKDEPAPYAFNNFTNVKIPDEGMQMYPHVDGNDMVAAVIYLDPIEDGGTAFYRQAEMQDIGYDESDNVLVDVENHYDVAGVVPAKFNRCVIYPSWYMHGGWINDHAKYSKNQWRRTQVYFMKIKSM